MIATYVLLSLAILIRIFSNSFSNVFQKQLTSKGYAALQINFLSYFLLAIASISVCMFSGIPVFTREFWIYSLMGGLVGAVGNAFLVKALAKGELSVLGPINAYKSIVGLIAGIVLLGEYPGSWGLAGIGLIITGSYFVLNTPAEPFSLALFKKKEIQYRFIALLLTGIEAVLVKRVIVESSPGWAFASWCVFGAVFSFLLLRIFRSGKQRVPIKWDRFSVYRLLLLVLCVAAMQYTTNYTLSKMPVAYALALFQLSILLTVLLGKRLFNEGNLKTKLIGSFIMIAGSVLILLREA